MFRLALHLLLAHAVTAAVLTEKRTVRDSAGKQFQCTYKLNYNTKTVSKTKTKVTCTPKATGKTVVESFYVEALAKQAVITHTIKKGKGTISKISLEEYTPTSTAAPGPEDFTATHNCSCRLVPPKMMSSMQEEGAVGGRGLVRLSSRGRGHSSSSSTSLITVFLAALIGALAPSLLGGLLGRSLAAESEAEERSRLQELLARKLQDRQLLPGLLGGNTGGLQPG